MGGGVRTANNSRSQLPGALEQSPAKWAAASHPRLLKVLQHHAPLSHPTQPLPKRTRAKDEVGVGIHQVIDDLSRLIHLQGAEQEVCV